jgi:hypothetical protein
VRKLWIAVLVAALAVAVVPVQASANHTLAHKVKTLQGEVNRLQAEMNCLRRTGAVTFVGYAWYEGSLEPSGGPYPVHDPATDFTDTNPAVNFTQLTGGPADYWLVALNNTRSCRNKFGVVRNPYAGRVATQMGAITRLHMLSRIR